MSRRGAAHFFLASVGRLVGPAAVMAAGTMGAGAMAAFLLAGAWFGYALLWVIPLMLPVFVISADSASRIGALNPGRGLFTLIREEIGRPLAWAILLLVVPVHFLVCMGQISVMAATTRGLLAPGVADPGWPGESLLALVLAVATLWLVLSRGFDRMQWAMTLLMLLMFACFFLVALRGLADVGAILAGFRPRLPAPVPVGPGEDPRLASTSIIAMVGSAIAPAALLGLPYLSADAGGGRAALRRAFRLSVINLGLVFGAYAVLVVVAGSHALHPLPGHGRLADVAEAGEVLRAAFPGSFSGLGPVVFSLGLLTASMTTLVVAAQVTVYFVLDMVGQPWRFTEDNRVFHRALTATQSRLRRLNASSRRWRNL